MGGDHGYLRCGAALEHHPGCGLDGGARADHVVDDQDRSVVDGADEFLGVHGAAGDPGLADHGHRPVEAGGNAFGELDRAEVGRDDDGLRRQVGERGCQDRYRGEQLDGDANIASRAGVCGSTTSSRCAPVAVSASATARAPSWGDQSRQPSRLAKADERQTLLGILATDPALTGADRDGQILIADKNYYGREFEATLAEAGVDLIRPARKGEPPRAGDEFFKQLRQVIESINDTFKGQLDLEQHGGRTPAGVWVRIVQRVLALTRRDLAQRLHRPAHQTVATGLRPLTPRNRSSRRPRRGAVALASPHRPPRAQCKPTDVSLDRPSGPDMRATTPSPGLRGRS